MNYKQIKYILYAIIFLYFIVAAFILLTLTGGVDFDAALCIKMADNAYKHIPFNNYAHPDPQNLNKDGYEFMTWWSPGQYVLPLLIKNFLNVKLEIALKILTAICLLFSGFGIFKLYGQLVNRKKYAGLPNDTQTNVIVLVSLVFTIGQPFFLSNLFFYDGGGILMLTWCPWFIWWVIKFGRITFYSLLTLLFLSLIGFFLKIAFTSIFMGALFYLFLSKSIIIGNPFDNQNLRKLFLNAFYLGLVFAVYIFIVKTVFLNHNTNISDSSTGIRLQPRVLVYPVVAPMLGMFSLDFIDRTYQWIIAAAFILPVYYLILKSKAINLSYKYILISFGGICIAFFSILYVLNVDVSYALRHYRIITILLTPAFFISIWRGGNWGKYFAGALLSLCTVINITYFVKALAGTVHNENAVSDYSGLQSPFPAALIKKIHSLDNLKDKGREIFYFKNVDPAVALEVRNNRVLLEDNFANFHFNNSLRFKPTLYFGYNIGAVYMIYPLNDFKQDSTTYFTRFERYKKFEKIYQTGGYAIYQAVAMP